MWQRVGDSNSCVLSVRRFSRPLGYQLPIPSVIKLSKNLVGPEGVEPSRPWRRFLRPMRLPIPPEAHGALSRTRTA
jgi:hypothetical protein